VSAATATARSAPDLLNDARIVLDNQGAIPSGSWPRAVALLCRQAIEKGLADLWAAVDPAMANVRQKRAQFICLRSYLDPDVARTTHQTWAMLSDACHHHVYDLPPTEAELRRWLDSAETFLRAVGAALDERRDEPGVVK